MAAIAKTKYTIIPLAQETHKRLVELELERQGLMTRVQEIEQTMHTMIQNEAISFQLPGMPSISDDFRHFVIPLNNER